MGKISDVNKESFLRMLTYDGRDGKVILLRILEETEDIIANDDAGLAGENVLDTHFPFVESAWNFFNAELCAGSKS